MDGVCVEEQAREHGLDMRVVGPKSKLKGQIWIKQQGERSRKIR
jgi:hypothetical protein